MFYYIPKSPPTNRTKIETSITQQITASVKNSGKKNKSTRGLAGYQDFE